MTKNVYELATEGYAVPGDKHIIDAIDPRSGLTIHFQKSHATILAEYPTAEKINLEEWQTAMATEQHTPIEWIATTKEWYWDMLGALPPIDFNGKDFLVGEPSDHDFGNGRPRYSAYRVVETCSKELYQFYFVSSRPLTRPEFHKELEHAIPV
jgi:hypothetical protein